MKISKRLFGKKGLSKRNKGAENVMDKVWIKIQCIHVWNCQTGNKTKRTNQQKFKVIFKRQEASYVGWNNKNFRMYTYMTWRSTQHSQGLEIPIGDKQEVSESKKRLNTEFSAAYIHSVNVVFKYKQAIQWFQARSQQRIQGI